MDKSLKVGLIIIILLAIIGGFGYIIINKINIEHNVIEIDSSNRNSKTIEINSNIIENINEDTENILVSNTTTSITKEEKIETTEKSSSNNDTSKIIVIDPGHQKKGDNSKEPIGPGASEMKAKVTTGATGVSTKQTEAELNLKVGLKLKIKLENKGYKVIMTRTTNNVNLSNSQRAEIANKANADAFIRIHADSFDNSSVVRNVYFVSNF